MERKTKVTQDAVNTACEQLQSENKNVTVNAVIGLVGGSFSTVGSMVKRWKEEQTTQAMVLPDMPDRVKMAMHKASLDIWGAASALASETVERIQNETGEAISKAQNELAEYSGEVSRLEKELDQSQEVISTQETKLNQALSQLSEFKVEKTALQTRLDDRDVELERLRSDYDKLQTQLIDLAKAQSK